MTARDVVRTILVLAVAAALAGCAAKPFALRYETSGEPLTGKQAEKLASRTDISALSTTPTERAPEMRASVLAGLRAKGPAGQRVADLLTEGFPERTTAVPVLVRVSSVDSTGAVIVVEAFGDDGATLTHRRLWVFSSATGALLRAASFR